MTTVNRQIALQPRITWTIDGYRPWVQCQGVCIETCDCRYAHQDIREAALCSVALMQLTRRSFTHDAYTMPQSAFDGLIRVLEVTQPLPHPPTTGTAGETLLNEDFNYRLVLADFN